MKTYTFGWIDGANNPVEVKLQARDEKEAFGYINTILIAELRRIVTIKLLAVD